MPGLVLAVLTALVARFLHGRLPGSVAAVVGEVLVAVALGLLIGNLFRLPAAVGPGLKVAVQGVLRIAIVLLGASLSLAEIGKVGIRALVLVALLMTLALTLAHGLSRLLGIPPRLGSLIGVGTAVCGNSAISATAPVIGAKDEEVSFAIATNTLFGTLAVLAYPLLGRALGLSESAFGVWAGSAVNDTSQVVAAGFAYGETAGQVATTVKLTRNALMGVVIVIMGWLYRSGEPRTVRGGFALRFAQSVPVFVWGFLALAALRSFGVLGATSDALGVDLVAGATWAAKLLILVALAAVGLTTRFRDLAKIGFAPFLIGLVVATACSAASLALIRFAGLG